MIGGKSITPSVSAHCLFIVEYVQVRLFLRASLFAPVPYIPGRLRGARSNIEPCGGDASHSILRVERPYRLLKINNTMQEEEEVLISGVSRSALREKYGVQSDTAAFRARTFSSTALEYDGIKRVHVSKTLVSLICKALHRSHKQAGLR